VCERVPAGALPDAEVIERVVDHGLGTRDVVPLVELIDTEEFVRRNGRILRVGLEDGRYTTAELLAHERRLLHAAEHGRMHAWVWRRLTSWSA
jgi:hypothetical protein